MALFRFFCLSFSLHFLYFPQFQVYHNSLRWLMEGFHGNRGSGIYRQQIKSKSTFFPISICFMFNLEYVAEIFARIYEIDSNIMVTEGKTSRE